QPLAARRVEGVVDEPGGARRRQEGRRIERRAVTGARADQAGRPALAEAGTRIVHAVFSFQLLLVRMSATEMRRVILCQRPAALPRQPTNGAAHIYRLSPQPLDPLPTRWSRRVPTRRRGKGTPPPPRDGNST